MRDIDIFDVQRWALHHIMATADKIVDGDALPFEIYYYMQLYEAALRIGYETSVIPQEIRDIFSGKGKDV